MKSGPAGKTSQIMLWLAGLAVAVCCCMLRPSGGLAQMVIIGQKIDLLPSDQTRRMGRIFRQFRQQCFRQMPVARQGRRHRGIM